MSSNATMVTADGAWTLQSLNTSVEGRYAIGALLGQANVQSGSITPDVTWRSGVLPSSSYQGTVYDLLVTQNSSPNLNLLVYTGACVIPRTGQGPYVCYNTTVKTVTVNAGDATNPRRDLIVARVYDAGIGDAQTGFAIEVVTGTPAASPSDPAVPTGAIPLTRVSVTVNATSITNANLTDLRTTSTVPGSVRTLLGGDSTSMSADGYLHGELRFRKATGSFPDLIDYWGSDGSWHTVNDVMRCRVQLASAFSLGANSDVFAQTGWFTTEDVYGMAHLSGTVGTYSYIQVPISGLYCVEYRSSMTSVSGATVVGQVTKNAIGGPGTTNSVARDDRAGVNAGGDGTWVHANREVVLAAGDKLYWGNWSSVNTNVAASFFGLPTEVYVRRIGN